MCMISAVSATALSKDENCIPVHQVALVPSSLACLAEPRLREPSTNQTAVPARKLTRFCPTWMRILFTSRIPVEMVEGDTPDTSTLSSTWVEQAVQQTQQNILTWLLLNIHGLLSFSL